jgi:hypothetical protein
MRHLAPREAIVLFLTSAGEALRAALADGSLVTKTTERKIHTTMRAIVARMRNRRGWHERGRRERAVIMTNMKVCSDPNPKVHALAHDYITSCGYIS